MLIQLSDLSLLDDLCAHFRRAGFICTPAGGSMVEVTRPDAPSREQERHEVDLHLRIWQATNPGTQANVVAR